MRIQRSLAGVDPGSFDETTADLNRDGEITIVDAVLIQQRLADLRDPAAVDIIEVDAPAEVGLGESFDVEVTVTNTGGLAVVRPMTVAIETGTTGGVSTLDLGPETTTTTTLTLAAGFVPGAHTLATETPAGTATTTVVVRTSR